MFTRFFTAVLIMITMVIITNAADAATGTISQTPAHVLADVPEDRDLDNTSTTGGREDERGPQVPTTEGLAIRPLCQHE